MITLEIQGLQILRLLQNNGMMIYIFKKIFKSFKLKLAAIFLCLAIALSIISVLGNKKLTQPSIIEQRQSSVFLSLQSPSDRQIIKGKNLLVEGKTLPKSTVVIFTENNVNSIESDSNGNFKESIELSSGLNKLTVSAFTPNGEEKKVALDIVYDDSDKVKGDKESKDEDHGKSSDAPGQVKKQEEAPQQSQSSQQSQSPQEQPKQEQPPAQENKAEQQASSGQTSQEPEPEQKATVGNVERVTTSSIVVEEKKFKQQIETKVDKNTIIKNQDNKTLELRKIKPKDEVAIITEKGSTDNNITIAPGEDSSLDKAARIYVNQATSSAQSKRHAVQGIITNVAGNNISIAHLQQTNRNFTFSVSDETVVKVEHIDNATIEYLKAGQLIVAVGDLTDQNILMASWIHVIKDVESSVPVTPVPSQTILPSEIPLPSIISTITSVLTPSIALTPSPAPVPCSLTSASWNTPSNPVLEGTSVGLKVKATGECVEKQVTFEIFESDSLLEGVIDDQINVQSSPITFSGNLGEVEGEWTIMWENDCLGLCNPPEYYFKASLVDGNTIQSGSPLLMVEPLNSSQLTPTPSPTPTLEVTSVDLIAKYIGVGQTGINQYLSFTAQYYSPNTIPLASMTNYNQGLLARHTYWYDDQVIYDSSLVIHAKTDWMYNFPFDTTIKPILITAGTHKIKACIDTSDVIPESDNVNNCKEVSFEALSVTLPPLSPCYTTLDEACAAINCPLDAQHFCSNRTVPNRPGCVEATGCTTLP